MLVKVKLEEFKSVDQNYQGGEKYHKGEKVYFGNPDSEYHGAYGKFQRIEKRDYPGEDICIVEITSPLHKIMTFREAAEKYGIDSSALRHARLDNRFREGEIRKSGGTWLVTREAMERLYGNQKGEGKMLNKPEMHTTAWYEKIDRDIRDISENINAHEGNKIYYARCDDEEEKEEELRYIQENYNVIEVEEDMIIIEPDK